MPFQFIHVQQGKGASASDRQAAFDMFCLLAYQVNQYKDYDGCCRMIVRATTSSGGTYSGVVARGGTRRSTCSSRRTPTAGPR